MSKKETKYDKFCKWSEKHPWKSMIFVELPLCVITSFLTTLLVVWLGQIL